MTDTNPDHSLRGALGYGAAWIASIALTVDLLIDFRNEGRVSLLSNVFEGDDAVLLLGALVIVPVTLLALALRKLQQYAQRRRRE